MKRYNCLLLAKPLASNSQTTQVSSEGFEPQWSPDGRSLAFMRWSQGQVNLWAVKAARGEEKQLTQGGIKPGSFSSTAPNNRFEAKDYCWSPDSSKIAYCAKIDGASNIWAVSIDELSSAKITSNNDPDLYFRCPLWSRDGKRLAYVTSAEQQPDQQSPPWSLWITDAEKSRIVFQTDSIMRLIGWSASGNELFVGLIENNDRSRTWPTEVRVFRVRADGGGFEMIADLKSVYVANIFLSPNGRFLAFVAAEEDKDNIWLLPSAGGEAKKITANLDPRIYISSLAWAPNEKALYYGKQTSWSLVMMIDNFR